MRFVIAFLLCLCAAPALAIQDQPREAKPCCACGVHCGCTGVCYCPRLVTFLDGSKAVFVPAPPRWPAAGSLPAILGKGARWSVGAPQRVPVKYRVWR